MHILRPLNRYNNGVLFLVSGEGANTKVTRVADTPGGEVASAGPDRLILTGAGQSRLQLGTSTEPFATWTNLDLVALLGLRSGEEVRGTSSPASDNQSAYVGVVTGTPDPKMIENDTNRRAWVVRIDRDGTPTIAYQAQTDALPVVAARSGSVSVAIGRAIFSKLGASSWRTEPEAPAIVTSLTSTAKGLVAITTDGACGDQRNEECRPLSCNLTTDSYLLRPNGWQSIQLP